MHEASSFKLCLARQSPLSTRVVDMTWGHNSSDPHTLKTDDTVASEGTALAQRAHAYCRLLFLVCSWQFLHVYDSNKQQQSKYEVSRSLPAHILTHIVPKSLPDFRSLARSTLTRLLRGPTTHRQTVVIDLYPASQEPPQAHPSFASTSLIVLTSNPRNAGWIDTDSPDDCCCPPSHSRSNASASSPASESSSSKFVLYAAATPGTLIGISVQWPPKQLQRPHNVVSLAQSCGGHLFSMSGSPR